MKARIDEKALVHLLFEKIALSNSVNQRKIRVWLTYATIHKTADGNSDNGFVHATLMVRQGKPKQELEEITNKIFTAMCEFLECDYNKNPLAISLEVRHLSELLLFSNA